MIVATTIMGIAVAGLMSGISSSTRNAARLRDYDRVVQLARLRMNSLLTDPRVPRNVLQEGLFDPAHHRRPGMRLARAGQRGGEIAHAGRRATTYSTAFRWKSGGCPAASGGASRWTATGGAPCGRRISWTERCDEAPLHRRRDPDGAADCGPAVEPALGRVVVRLADRTERVLEDADQADGQPARGRRAAHSGAGTGRPGAGGGPVRGGDARAAGPQPGSSRASPRSCGWCPRFRCKARGGGGRRFWKSSSFRAPKAAACAWWSTRFLIRDRRRRAACASVRESSSLRTPGRILSCSPTSWPSAASPTWTSRWT